VFLRRTAVGVVLAAGALGGAATVNPCGLAGFKIVTAFVTLVVFMILGWRLLTMGRVVAPTLSRYELLISDRVLRRSSVGSLAAAEVLRPEVNEIVETPAGLWVTCTTPRRSAFVVRALDGYADVREALSAWTPIKPLRGWAAFVRTGRETGYEGPRDAVLGTALATDATLVTELEAVRAASTEGYGVEGYGVQAPAAAIRRPFRTLVLWVGLVVMFLAIWQVLQPSERAARTDQDCQSTSSCRAAGVCKARGTRCVAATDDDCRQAEVCTSFGRCRAAGGQCYEGGDRSGTAPSSR